MSSSEQSSKNKANSIFSYGDKISSLSMEEMRLEYVVWRQGREDISITFSFPTGDLDETLENFKRFLMSAGFPIDFNQRIDLVTDEGDENNEKPD